LADHPPGVSIVIPVVDAASTIAEAVASGLQQDYPGAVEVVVALGPTTDTTGSVLAELAGRDQRVRIVDNPTGSTPAGLNRAIAASTGTVIVRCDAQSVLPAGYVSRGVDLLEETGADNVGGVQAAEGVTPIQRAIALAQTSRLGVGDARYRTGGSPGPVDTVYLGVFRRSVFQRFGWFDETLHRNQDYELNYRIRAGGGTVYFHPDLAVTYRPRRSLRALWRQYFDYGKWKRVVLWRHLGSLRWRQLVPPTFVMGLLASLGLAFTPWRWAGAVIPAVYLIGVLTATALALRRSRDPAAALLPSVFPTMHLAWGFGFLVGCRPRTRPGRAEARAGRI
jgi:glycosyltransferase involved in cell wall biosynthesis